MGSGGGGSPGQITQGTFQKSPNWILGQTGGSVPGPTGSPQKAILHGGELIVPNIQAEGLRQLFGMLGLGQARPTLGLSNLGQASLGLSNLGKISPMLGLYGLLSRNAPVVKGPKLSK